MVPAASPDWAPLARERWARLHLALLEQLQEAEAPTLAHVALQVEEDLELLRLVVHEVHLGARRT